MKIKGNKRRASGPGNKLLQEGCFALLADKACSRLYCPLVAVNMYRTLVGGPKLQWQYRDRDQLVANPREILQGAWILSTATAIKQTKNVVCEE